MEDLNKIEKDFEEKIKNIKTDDELQKLSVEFLGRKGILTAVLKNIADFSLEEKKRAGREANQLRDRLKALIEERQKDFASTSADFIDPSLPGKKIRRGSIHPITMIRRELEEIFRSMGFMILQGPELESDYYCFEALNIPAHHPARDMQDTFYVSTQTGPSTRSARSGPSTDSKQIGADNLVMRTHTSPVQVRAMQKYGAPLRCVSPGRVYRSEAIDACHEHTFDQMEGLMVGENINLGNLIAVMQELLKGIFNKEMVTRVRPGYFPFVEPGIELDIKCTICGGEGCSSCKHSGWLELLPAGMVHPEVLKHGQIDAKKYTGFAFGLGLTRLAMMKYGIADIRYFNSGDLRFLEQF